VLWQDSGGSEIAFHVANSLEAITRGRNRGIEMVVKELSKFWTQDSIHQPTYALHKIQ